MVAAGIVRNSKALKVLYILALWNVALVLRHVSDKSIEKDWHCTECRRQPQYSKQDFLPFSPLVYKRQNILVVVNHGFWAVTIRLKRVCRTEARCLKITKNVSFELSVLSVVKWDFLRWFLNTANAPQNVENSTFKSSLLGRKLSRFSKVGRKS